MAAFEREPQSPTAPAYRLWLADNLARDGRLDDAVAAYDAVVECAEAADPRGQDQAPPPKDPRSAIYAAMLIGEYPDEIRTTKPPNGVLKALAVVGKALRFKL